MNENINKYEMELIKVKREGIKELITYLRESDAYTCPSSTVYHSSFEGGNIQHCLNVLNLLKGFMKHDEESGKYVFDNGPIHCEYEEETLIIVALLHDLCKNNFYKVSSRNVKDATGKWVSVPYYTVEDLLPLGHGEKSVMIAQRFIRLTPEEMFAIRWHMGIEKEADLKFYYKAVGMYPLVWLLNSADVLASQVIEDVGGKPNKLNWKEA